MTEYHPGGYIPGTVQVELQEGEKILDRDGNVVAAVVGGKLVRLQYKLDGTQKLIVVWPND